MAIRDTVTASVEAHVAPIGKLKRMLGYGAVGVTGIVVDLGIVEASSLLGIHHLLAVTAAFWVAMTWNFTLQRRYVYRAAQGNPVRQYLRYLFVDVSAFAVRVGVVIATVDLSSPWLALPYVPYPVGPAVPASAVGILCGFIVGFQGTDELVFGEHIHEHE